MLQPLIDQANEKGWRKKEEAYLVRKQELEEREEVETRLSQTPKVIADAMEMEYSLNSVNSAETVEVDTMDINGNIGHTAIEITKDAPLGSKQEQENLSSTPKVESSETESEDDEVDYVEFLIDAHGFDVDTPKWHYFDPQGDIHGLFNLRTLKKWFCDYYFEDDAIIWKTGQNPEDDGVRMAEVLISAFHIEPSE